MADFVRQDDGENGSGATIEILLVEENAIGDLLHTEATGDGVYDRVGAVSDSAPTSASAGEGERASGGTRELGPLPRLTSTVLDVSARLEKPKVPPAMSLMM